MKCPFCSFIDTRVVDSRDVDESRSVRRRRECEKCSKRFTTYEETEVVRIRILKRDGKKEEYKREKLRSGLEKALEKRPVSSEEVDKLLGAIESALYAKDGKEVTSKELGKLVMQELKKVDEVAYIRFASVYKSFGSVSSFRKEIDKLGE